MLNLEHYPIEKLKKEVLGIIGNRLDIKKYKVFFFGSRAAGKGNERSDIDIGIEGKKPIPDKAWVEIQDEIENIPTLYKIDIVDFRQTAKKFREVAKQYIEIIKND